jgi:hemerythrin
MTANQETAAEEFPAQAAAAGRVRDSAVEQLALIQSALERFVPPMLLKLLGKESILELEVGHQVEKKMTILFSDIRGFASLSERMSPQQCFGFINAYLSCMEPVVQAHGGFIDKYIGDSVMALFPARGDDALRAALAMLAELDAFNARRPDVLASLGLDPADHLLDQSVRIGIGLNSGLLMLGVIGGRHRMEVTVVSDAVNLASRVETLTKTYQTPILITQHTLNSIRHAQDFSIRFIDRVRVRGKHLAQSIYEVFDGDPAPLKAAKLASRETFEEALANYHFQRMDEALRLFGECLERNPGDTPAEVYWHRCRQSAARQGDAIAEVREFDAWRSEYRLGRADLDEVHHSIFEQILALAEVLRRDSVAAAERSVDNLVETTLQHFAAEEELMICHGYTSSAYMEHCQQHRKFREFLGLLAQDIREDKVTALRLAFRCQFLLLDWFVSHISIVDRHLERFLVTNPALQAA